MTISNSHDLTDKIALVTGAGSGLGKYVTQQLIQEGAKVVMVGRTLATLEETARPHGSNALTVRCDVSNPNDVRHVFSVIEEHFGGLDILINNAGVYEPFLLDNATDEQFQKIIGTNLMGPMYCMREAIKSMKQRGAGDIVNVSSESARIPFPYLNVYAASKSGLEALSLGQRMELKESNIRVVTFRAGTMLEPGVGASLGCWTQELLDSALATWDKTGHNFFAGKGMHPATAAAAMVNTLKQPREATTDLIEIRSSL